MRRQQRSRSPVSKLVIFIVALVALYGGYYWGNQHQRTPPNHSLIRLLAAPRPLQSVDLTDQFGEPFTEQRLQDHWSLILFGYGHSPAQSGDMLTLCTRILNRLADRRDLQRRTQVIFVTVDPERDKPEVLRNLLAHYSQDFLGITGSVAQLSDFARQLGASFQRQAGGNDADYRVGHSTSIALVDPQARLIGLFTGLVDTVNIASDLKLIAEEYSANEPL